MIDDDDGPSIIMLPRSSFAAGEFIIIQLCGMYLHNLATPATVCTTQGPSSWPVKSGWMGQKRGAAWNMCFIMVGTETNARNEKGV